MATGKGVRAGWTPRISTKRRGPGKAYGPENPMPKSRQRVEVLPPAFIVTLPGYTCILHVYVLFINSLAQAVRELVINELRELQRYDKVMHIPSNLETVGTLIGILVPCSRNVIII